MPDSFVPGLFSCEIEEWYEKRPDFPIITFENGEHPAEQITYADIFLKGCKLAAALKRAGIGKGDRFCLVMRNHPEFLYAMQAASLTGSVVVPIDPRSKGGKLSYQLTDSGAKGVIFTNEYSGEVMQALEGLKDIAILGVVYKPGFDQIRLEGCPDLAEVLEGPQVPPPDGRNLDLKSPMQIIYTSGTTGDPKGVVLKADRMLMYKVLGQIVWQYAPDDVLYTGLSLSHGNAQAVTVAPSLMLGIRSVVSRSFTKSRLWDICRRYGATTFSLLGGMMMGIYSEPRRPDDADNPVHTVISAGTPVAIWKAFEERFGVKIHEWYAAVEGGFAHNPVGVGPVGSFGKPLEGIMEMKVVREDDTECEPGEIGELISRMAGSDARGDVEYHGKKEASEAKTRGGWLRSGDMCHRDEQGWFYFDFRKGGGLRRHGDFIQPEYVEKALAELPEISDVCVYGIPSKTGAPGESDLVAAVVLAGGSHIDPGRVLAALKASLEPNSIPSYLQVVQEIPKSASEKNLERLLRDAFDPGAANVYALSGAGRTARQPEYVQEHQAKEER
ncbi:MAG: AMP-binding protein [Desulfomonilia bacterium]